MEVGRKSNLNRLTLQRVILKDNFHMFDFIVCNEYLSRKRNTFQCCSLSQLVINSKQDNVYSLKWMNKTWGFFFLPCYKTYLAEHYLLPLYLPAQPVVIYFSVSGIERILVSLPQVKKKNPQKNNFYRTKTEVTVVPF